MQRFFALIYWNIIQFKYRNTDLPQNLTPKEITNRGAVLTRGFGRHRKPGEPCGMVIDETGYIEKLRDALLPPASPGWVQHCMNEIKNGNSQPIDILGRSDYALWCVKCMHPVYQSFYFMQQWEDDNHNRIIGPAICVYILKPKPANKRIYYTGNWGICGPYKNLEEISHDLIRAFSGKKAIRWSIRDHNFCLVDSGEGIPTNEKLSTKAKQYFSAS